MGMGLVHLRGTEFQSFIQPNFGYGRNNPILAKLLGSTQTTLIPFQ